jgi:hypothetical protein
MAVSRNRKKANTHKKQLAKQLAKAAIMAQEDFF